MARIFQDMVLGPFLSRNNGKKVVGGWALAINKNLGLMTGLIETGKVKPVIDKRYPLDRAAEAFRVTWNPTAYGGGYVLMALP